MDIKTESLNLHYKLKGKLEIKSKTPVASKKDLALAYTPGVAQPCLEIERDNEKSYELTGKGNTIAVITDGSAVLGLGNIGYLASMPVMEGKCVLFKEFGGVDALPLCISSNDVDEIVNTIKLISGSFGGINLEDISAPRCFEIEKRLKEVCDIPVFHDDQHGTAVVVAAAAINACRVTGRKTEEQRLVINGAGSAGMACARLLSNIGFKGILLVDKGGIICGDSDFANEFQREFAAENNTEHITGTLSDALAGADIFIGVSAPNVLSKEMIKTMHKDPIIFAMANPTPEIMPDEAEAAGAAVVGTGRSDFKNQINNVLAFPGIFRGALDARASDINEEMKMAAAFALADFIPEDKLSGDKILPEAFEKGVGAAVAKAVAKAARESGVSRI